MKTIITGDLHGNFIQLNAMIKQESPDLVKCCGDFGYWPRVDYIQKVETINTVHTKVLFCDGNHEDHWELQRLKNLAVAPNVFYQPRGSTYRLPDGRNVLFMGGGVSIDKHLRTVGYDWFPEETITQKDFMNLPDEPIDIFITHTCSHEIYDNHIKSAMGHGLKDNDPCYSALSSLWEMYKPAQWFFGHFHVNLNGIYKGTRWHCLGAVGHGPWWMELTD